MTVFMEAGMRAKLLKLSLVLAAVASPALAGAMFSALPTDTGAALGVMFIGVLIFMFTAVLSVGALIGGTWQAVHNWRDAHHSVDHRRGRAG
jgi:hypothetical protein